MGTQDLGQGLDDDLTGVWRHVGHLIVRGQARMDARFERLEGDVSVLKTDVGVLKTDVGVLKTDVGVLKTDVAVLKTDVAVLKTDVAETKEQLGRLERSTDARFNRVDGQLERLITLVQRSERSSGR